MPINPEDWPKFDEKKRYVLKGKTLNFLGDLLKAITPIAGKGIKIHKTELGRRISTTDEPVDDSSSGSSDSSPSDSSSDISTPSGDSSGPDSTPSGSSQDSSKEANVRVEIDGEERWIAWVCEERPSAIFADVAVIEISGGDLLCGQANHRIPEEFIQSTVPGTIIVTSHVADSICDVAAKIVEWDGVPFIAVGLREIDGFRSPSQVVVKYEATRKGHGERWKRRSPEEAQANEAFWAASHVTEG